MCIDIDGLSTIYIYIYDTINTTTVVVLFWTFVYDMLI